MRNIARQTTGLLLGLFSFSVLAAAQDLSLSDELAWRLKSWAAANPRAEGTLPEDWRYTLPAGVTTKQVAYYSDETACYAKLFYPPGFDSSRAYPAVILGHGTNAISIALEKYAAVFAAHGLVAMAIDYRGYGFSDGWVILDEEDTSTDEQRITHRTARVMIKRTRLLTVKQVEDFRSAISYLQGEPGVDPERIGLWGSSLSGGTAIATAGLDARVKAVVAQVGAVGRPRGTSGPQRFSDQMLEDAILRARTGQGAEVDAGFSIRTKIDLETQQRRAELRSSELVSQLPTSTAVLFLPAEHDELVPARLSFSASEFLQERGNPTDVVVIPSITHFQAYAGPAFEATSTLAANWFVHHLK